MKIFKTVKTEESRGQFSYFKEMLLQIETNVWACIYRICDKSRSLNENKRNNNSGEEQQTMH